MPLLQIKSLRKKFGGASALTDFNLSLERGEKRALIGPNGAGKTTVLNLLSGFYQPDGGSIIFDGENLSGLKPHCVAMRGIGRTFQNIRLWDNLDVLDNVRLVSAGTSALFDVLMRTKGWRKTEQRSAQEALTILQLTGLEKFAGQKAGKLPYGLRRRVELARALALKPGLLLLDEPAAGLSTKETIELTALINRLQKKYGFAILMIEHRMKMVMELCDEITVLDFGRVIAEGPPGQIRNNRQVIEAYLGGGLHA